MDQQVTDFWSATRSILDETPIDAVLTECPERSGREYETWNIAVSSYSNQRLRGFYTVPRDVPPSGKFPAMLAVPGYGGAKKIPYHVVMQGFAVLTLFPRAQGESVAEWDLPHGTKLTYNVTDRDTYYYRAGYMDCVRGVDFLAQRDEVAADRIGMWSRSQGGGFTLATAGLDQRVAAAVAEEPFMCNYPVAIDIDTRPYHELYQYVREHPEQRDRRCSTRCTTSTPSRWRTLSNAPSWSISAWRTLPVLTQPSCRFLIASGRPSRSWCIRTLRIVPAPISTCTP